MGILHRLLRNGGSRVADVERALLNSLGLVRPPVAVQWISTSACELSCPHCYSDAGRRSQGELTTAEAQRLIIDELVKLGRPTLVIAGGEALLRRDLPEIIRYAHSRRVPWALHSHGGRVEPLIDLFEQCPPVMVAISLDGPRAYHDGFRGRDGSFDAALRAIRALKRIGCREVVAGTTVNRQNADLLADLFPIVMTSGADSWGLHLVTPEGRASDHSELLPTATQLRRVAAFARRMRAVFHIELDNEWGSAGEDDCFYRDDRFVCGAGRFSCVISATGELMPCTTTDPRESQGNVRDRPLSKLWTDEFAPFRARNRSIESDEHDCWLQTRNGCSCRAAAFDHGPLGNVARALVPLTIGAGT